MRPYEIAIIFDVGLDENEIRGTIDRIGEIIAAAGGSVGRVDRWGRRTFAYELKHRGEGFYVFVEVSSEPPGVADVDRMLTLNDSVLRHRVIRQPDKPADRAPAATQSEPQAS